MSKRNLFSRSKSTQNNSISSRCGDDVEALKKSSISWRVRTKLSKQTLFAKSEPVRTTDDKSNCGGSNLSLSSKKITSITLESQWPPKSPKNHGKMRGDQLSLKQSRSNNSMFSSFRSVGNRVFHPKASRVSSQGTLFESTRTLRDAANGTCLPEWEGATMTERSRSTRIVQHSTKRPITYSLPKRHPMKESQNGVKNSKHDSLNESEGNAKDVFLKNKLLNRRAISKNSSRGKMARSVLWTENAQINIFSQIELGMSKAREGKWIEAQYILQEGLIFQKNTFGDNHPSVVKTLCQFSTILHRNGKSDEALKTLLEALKIQQGLCGDKNLQVASILVKIGEIQGYMGDFDNAIKALNAARRIEVFIGKEEDTTQAILNAFRNARKFPQQRETNSAKAA